MLDEFAVKALGERGSMALGPVTKKKMISKWCNYYIANFIVKQNYINVCSIRTVSYLLLFDNRYKFV